MCNCGAAGREPGGRLHQAGSPPWTEWPPPSCLASGSLIKWVMGGLMNSFCRCLGDDDMLPCDSASALIGGAFICELNSQKRLCLCSSILARPV